MEAKDIYRIFVRTPLRRLRNGVRMALEYMLEK